MTGLWVAIALVLMLVELVALDGIGRSGLDLGSRLAHVFYYSWFQILPALASGLVLGLMVVVSEALYHRWRWLSLGLLIIVFGTPIVWAAMSLSSRMTGAAWLMIIAVLALAAAVWMVNRQARTGRADAR